MEICTSGNPFIHEINDIVGTYCVLYVFSGSYLLTPTTSPAHQLKFLPHFLFHNHCPCISLSLTGPPNACHEPRRGGEVRLPDQKPARRPCSHSAVAQTLVRVL